MLQSNAALCWTPRLAIQDGNIDSYPQDNMLQTRNFYAQTVPKSKSLALPSSCDPPTLGTRCVPATAGRTFPKTCLLVKETKAPRIEQHDGHVRIV